MEKGAATGPRPGPPPRSTKNALPLSEDRWSADHPAWAPSLEPEGPSDLELNEGQQLQIAKELVGLQLSTHRLREQQEAEVFHLQSEVLRLESRVLELELCEEQASRGQRQAQAQSHPRDRRPQHATGARSQEPADPVSMPHGPGGGQWVGQAVWGPAPASVHPQRLATAERALEQQEAQRQALQTLVAALGRQLQGAREEARAAGERVALQAEALSACQRQLRQAEADNSQLQMQLKRLNEEHAVQLQRCARDVANYTDAAGQAPAVMSLQTFLEATLEGIRAAHRSREQQLARAARTYRKQLADLRSRHEALLAAHRLPQAVLDLATGDLELAPRHLTTELSHLQGTSGKETQRGTLQAQRGPGVTSLEGTSESQILDAASWAQIRQKLQDFSRGAQAELERERAQLLGRATAAEAQLSELRQYVDQHLGRYKQEILRLRKLGEQRPTADVIPAAQPPRPRTRSR
ncbi:coiled-coil domain-containing protein 78 [Echinops telfairi]|uniref:Coiled-coil domain-containing protein 78 n=1 Tax=Echinops telfairi TaxID=9371 RepID=A0AC55CRK8_ECHTE|nr:coiled-coil domain-containing protein 78 [Echinops telfairi]